MRHGTAQSQVDVHKQSTCAYELTPWVNSQVLEKCSCEFQLITTVNLSIWNHHMHHCVMLVSRTHILYMSVSPWVQLLTLVWVHQLTSEHVPYELTTLVSTTLYSWANRPSWVITRSHHTPFLKILKLSIKLVIFLEIDIFQMQNMITRLIPHI